MVGKLQSIVAASVVVGAFERNNAQVKRNSSNVQTDKNADSVQPAAVGKGEARFVVDTQGMQAEENNLFQQDEEKKPEFHLEPGTLDEESVDFMTKELNKLMSEINCNLEFTYHQEADMMSVKMVDKETQEVLKEFPPEEMIENMMKARDWLGAFIDKTF